MGQMYLVYYIHVQLAVRIQTHYKNKNDLDKPCYKYRYTTTDLGFLVFDFINYM